MINFDTATAVEIAIAMKIHKAKELKKIISLKELKPAVRCSINRNGNDLDHFDTLIDKKHGVNPKWNCLDKLIFNSTASTVKTDYVVLDVMHHGSILGERLIGQTTVPLELLMAGEGVGIKIRYPVFRSGERVGQIIVSHVIRSGDLISPDLTALSDLAAALSAAADVISSSSSEDEDEDEDEDNDDRRRPRFRKSSAFSLIAGCLSLAANTVEIAELI